jgi:hypothetical protein
MRALLAADYLSRLDSFPTAYPSYRVLGLELGAPAIPAYDEQDPMPYRRAVWTAQQRGRRALRDLEDAGLLKRCGHCAETNGAQRANDYLALTPALVVGLLMRAAGWGGQRPRDRKVPPRGQDGAPSEQDLQQDRDQQQQASRPAPPLRSALQPASPVAAVASSAASDFSTSAETQQRTTQLESSPAASPALSEVTLRRLWRSCEGHAAAIVQLCSRQEHRGALAEHAVSQLLRALEQKSVPSPIGYVARVLSDELRDRALAPQHGPPPAADDATPRRVGAAPPSPVSDTLSERVRALRARLATTHEKHPHRAKLERDLEEAERALRARDDRDPGAA